MTAGSGSGQIRDRLVSYFAAMLRVPAGQIATNVNVLELGADSIMLVEAQRWLREQFNCAIDVRQFFEELNTIDLLAKFLADAQHEETPRPSLELATTNTQPATMQRAVANPNASMQSLSLLQRQLALAGEVIEAQNRMILNRRQGGAILANGLSSKIIVPSRSSGSNN